MCHPDLRVDMPGNGYVKIALIDYDNEPDAEIPEDFSDLGSE